METLSIKQEMDLYTSMSKVLLYQIPLSEEKYMYKILIKGCQEEIQKLNKMKEDSEEIEQLKRVKESLLLDKDIIKQLKVYIYLQ